MAEGTGQIFGTIIFLLMLLASYLRKRRRQQAGAKPTAAPKPRRGESSLPVARVLARPIGFAPVAFLVVVALVVAYVVIDSPEARRWIGVAVLLVPVVYLVYKLRDYDLDVRRRS